jgi:hypothetical protein
MSFDGGIGLNRLTFTMRSPAAFADSGFGAGRKRGRPRGLLPGLGGKLAFARQAASFRALLISLTPAFLRPKRAASGNLKGCRLVTGQYS